MKRTVIFIAFLLITSTACAGSDSDKKGKEDVELTSYFGEQPPGLTPKIFEPAMLSPDGLFEGGSFTPDMQHFYFTRKNGKYKQRTFFVIQQQNGRWGQETETDIKWPQFSADGKVMYIGKGYRERTKTGWSALKSPGDFINKMAHGRSVSANGTYYYTVYENADIGEMYFARLKGGEYASAVKMSHDINTGEFIAHPYIAPDESYLIWDVRREGGYGQADLYISFRNQQGQWSPAINMGPSINTAMQESAPQVTHDGKYLFFTRGEWLTNQDGSQNYVGKRYWVDAQVIEKLKP
ncbi:hypothetical protein [Shewanella waksmanii]|uniref:hypothetical protein n=1 Tax=Shewanella waksmanii TaxID=213783 RepID=UPI0004904DCD|nr:hypothetical protein [Shewanella waksmanii]